MAALDSLLGNETLKESLSAALAAGRLSHSILLCGEAGTGAGFAARCLAADYLYPNGGASAAQVLAGQSPEYLLLAGEGVSGDIRVDRVREVRREIFNTALSAGGRAVHIKGADKLNGASANALLKVLEEPPEGVLFILTAPSEANVMATIRSREISASIILQSQSQLKTIYKDAAETIIGNCDTMLFLGGKESSTLKEISETLGKETIDLYNTSDTRGQSPSFGTTYQKTGKELMSRDELAVMDGSKCILQLRGVRPFLSDKFDITKHKRYKELSDFDKKNEFDVECYLKHELRLLTTEEFDLYEVDVTEQAQG